MTEHASHCPCEVEESMGYDDCPARIHVMCDGACGAVEEPETFDEMALALEHWRDHGYLRGCAHGS